MIAYKDITVLLFSLVSMYTTALAQEPHYQEQTNYSPLADIKQVTGFAADKNNCIWLGTQAGIYRYDGSHFRPYNVLNTPILKFERISEIFPTISSKGYGWYIQDAKGNLYTADSLSRIVPFKAHPLDPEMSIHNQHGYYNLIPGKSYTLNEEFKDNVKATHYLSSYRRIFLHLVSGTIRSMSIDDLYQSKKGDSLYSIGYNVSSRTFATDKNFYLATNNNILRWKGMDQKPSILALKGDIDLHGKTLRTDSLVFYRMTDPTVFLIGYKGCIYEATEINNGEALTTRLLVKDPSQKLPMHIYYSPSQRIILSYFSERGLVIYRPSRFSLLTLKGPDGTIPMLDYYYSVLPDGDGLITVNSKGIMRFGINGEKKVLLEGNYSRFFLYKDKKGNLWYDDIRTRHVSYMVGEKSIPVIQAQQGLSFCGAFQVNDSVYYLLGTKQLFKIVRKNNNFIPEIVVDKTTTAEEFNVLYELDENTFWLGSDQGLEEFDIRNKTIKPVEALKNSYVRSVIKLEKDNYLVGTYDKGIFQYFDKQWTQLPSAKGRLPSSAHGFVIDNTLQCVWVSSNDGLSRIPLNMLLRDETGDNSNTKISFIKDFGPDISPEFNGSSNISATKLSDTCIAFTNARGLVVFNPLKLISSPLPVRVLVEFPVDNKTDPGNKKRSAANQLVFTPVVPYYGDAGDLEISYRLTGIDKEWNILSGGSIISYNNIKPGNHDLQFRISNFHSQDGSERLLTSHRIFVATRWYQTTWFKFLAIALSVVIAIILHNIRIWYLQKRKRELEQMVKTKTSELRTANTQLSDTIEELKFSEANLKQSNDLKDEYFAVLTHDLRSPLRFLSFNICQLLDMLPEMESAKIKKGLVVAYECTNDVSKLIDDFVYWIRNNENQLQPRPVSTMISPIVADIKKLYGFSFEGNKNELVVNIPSELRFTTDPQMFFIMLRNAVDNANKYTTGGSIAVSAVQENGNLQVAVADTGSGIQEELVQQLTQLQYEDVQFGHKKRKSLGFYIMAMLTKKLGGSYSLSSVIGKGTVLSFTIPELKKDTESNP